MKSKHCDLDPAPTFLVKQCLGALLTLATKIINLSLSSGVFPAEWKQAIVSPLLKKVSLDTEVLKNYRPVSNLAFLSKVLEKVVSVQLMRHVEANGLLSRFQSAYRSKHSVETALLRVHNDITKALGSGRCVLLVLLLSAAFDTVNHDVLLSRLRRMGVQGMVLSWIRSYLVDRSQCVRIGSVTSDPVTLQCGVPQGSVLGPLLFTLYTAPLSGILERAGDTIDNGYHLYADDTQDYAAAQLSCLSVAAEDVSRCVTNVSSWLGRNGLACNDDKTVYMLIRSQFTRNVPEIPNIKIGECEIEPSETARNLGVIFDSLFNFKKQITSVVSSCNMAIRNISRVRKYLSPSSARIYTQLLVSSRLDFCNSVLSGLPASTLRPLQRVQNAAARLVTMTKRSDHISPVLADLHWLPVAQRIKFKIILFAFKALHGCAPPYINELVSTRPQLRSLRSSNVTTLQVPHVRLASYGLRSFSAAAPSLWNHLPSELRSCDDLRSFRGLLKTFLFEEAFA